MARFVLIHGAFHGAWCWGEAARRLRSAGHRVEAIDLPGSGEDFTSIESVTMTAYSDRVVAQLEGDPEPAILVGHSMGGMAITAAASRAPKHVAQLVYVTAFLPSDGESMISLSEKVATSELESLTVEGDPPLASVTRATAARLFYGECTSAVRDEALRRLRPQALVPFFAPVRVDEALQPPRRYVFTLRDSALSLPLQRRMVSDNPCKETFELDTDHSPFLSRPAELCSLLDRIAVSSDY